MARWWIWLLLLLMPLRAWSFGTMLIHSFPATVPPAELHTMAATVHGSAASGPAHCHDAESLAFSAPDTDSVAVQPDDSHHPDCANCSSCEVCHGAMLLTTAIATTPTPTHRMVVPSPSQFASVSHTPGHPPPIA